MTTSYDYAESPVTSIRGGGTLSPEMATAVVAGFALVALFAIRRGFRGVNVAGIHAGIS